MGGSGGADAGWTTAGRAIGFRRNGAYTALVVGADVGDVASLSRALTGR